MSLEDDAEILRKLPLFCELEHEALRLLAFQATVIELIENQSLFELGEAADGAFVVVNGSVAITKKNEVSIPEFVAPAGALIGRMALITDRDHTASAIVVEPCTLMKITRVSFQKILHEYPSSAARLRVVIAADLRDLTKELNQISD